MTVRVGVNGFGRIGRNFWRAVDAQNVAGTADIDAVSGATYTSAGYERSLQSALDRARG